MVMQHEFQFKNTISNESNILINEFDYHNLNEEVVAIFLHSHLATRKFVYTVEEMATLLTLAIVNMVIIHTLVNILLWLINLSLNRMKK